MEQTEPTAQTEQKFYIPYPSPEIFWRNTNSIAQVVAEQQEVFVIDRVEYPESGGIYVYHVGIPYPQKGFPFPEAIAAINVAKRLLISQIRFLATTEVLLSRFFFLLLPYKRKIKVIEKWLKEFCGTVDTTLEPYYLKENRYSPIASELIKFIDRFLVELGIDYLIAYGTARIFATLIEYDSAYRLRLEDIFSESSKEKMLENPSKEFERLLHIFRLREVHPLIQDRFASLVKIVSWFLVIPRIKKAFKKALKYTTFSNLQLDEADRYHVLRLGGYKFFGESTEARREKYLALHNGNPPLSITVKGA